MVSERRKVRERRDTELLEEKVSRAVENCLARTRRPSDLYDHSSSFEGPERVVRVNTANLGYLSSADGLLVGNNSECFECSC
jgi:hypothetical protein